MATAWQCNRTGGAALLVLELALLLGALPAAAAAPALPHVSAATDSLRVAVCVLGQLSRMEITSKLENLVKPNLAEGTRLDMFLLLQPGEARYTNKALPECTIAPPSLEAAAAPFANLTHTVTVTQEYMHYALQPGKWPDYAEVGLRRERRLTNHINQYLSWKRCARLAAKAELETGDRYDAVLRLRDNALVLRPFSLRAALTRWVRAHAHSERRPLPDVITREQVRQLPVFVKACSDWGGYNDKVTPAHPTVALGMEQIHCTHSVP